VHLTSPAPFEGAIVTLALDDPSAQCVVPVSVVVPAGAISASFVIQTSSVSSAVTVTMSGTYGVTRRASFVLTDAASAPAAEPPQSQEEPSKPPTFEDTFNEG